MKVINMIIIFILFLSFDSFASMNPRQNELFTYFDVRKEATDSRITWGFTDRFRFGFRGVRTDWPKANLELHYGLFEADLSILSTPINSSGFLDLTLGAGLGLANKLNGINRLAYLALVDATLVQSLVYLNLSTTFIGANDFYQKNFVKSRLGLFAKKSEDNSSVSAMVLMNAFYENHADHLIEWGPSLRTEYQNITAEWFLTFKGAYSFSLGYCLKL
jgi:hypothetical protein